MKMGTLGHYLMRSAALLLILYGFFESGQFVNWIISKALELFRLQTETWDLYTLTDTIQFGWACVVGFVFGGVLWFHSRKISGFKPEETDTHQFHVHFRLMATIMISTLGLYMIAFGLILLADRMAPTIFNYQDNMLQWAETPEDMKKPELQPNPLILLSPIYQPLITTLFGLLLTELRRPIARLIMPVGIEPSDEIIESYHLFHRLILTILALIGFGFGLQWIGDSITGIAEFLNNAMANLTESGLNYRMWAELTGPIQAPLVQLLLSVLLICLAKPISQWLKPYKAK